MSPDAKITQVSNSKNVIGRKNNLKDNKKKKETEKRKSPKKIGKKIKKGNNLKKKAENNFQKDFVIDRTELNIDPVKEKNKKKNSTNVSSSSPWAQQIMFNLLSNEPSTEKSDQTPFRSKKSCYNCDGEHNLADCLLPKNFNRINEKRRTVGSEIRTRQLKYKRITDEYEKNYNFKAGIIGSELRKALGIGNNDIPEYIYRMRRMGFIKGYPPGYLMKAIKNGETNKLLTIHEIEPTDEIVVKHEKAEAPILDQSKIISYPGFNSVDKGLNDLQNFRIPPLETFCEIYQKELQLLFKHQKNVAKKSSKKERKRKSKKTGSNDVIVIKKKSAKVSKAEGKTPGENEEVVIHEGSLQEKENLSNTSLCDENLKEGESIFQSVGTPVILKHKLELPTLEAFSIGIIPFEAREEGEQKGIFKKLMSQLKNNDTNKTEKVAKVKSSKKNKNK